MKTRNVAALSLIDAGTPVIDGQKLSAGTSFEKVKGKWRVAKTSATPRKKHGLQGPIDDAFMESFVTVNPPPAFAREWAKWMRGDLKGEAD